MQQQNNPGYIPKSQLNNLYKPAQLPQLNPNNFICTPNQENNLQSSNELQNNQMLLLFQQMKSMLPTLLNQHNVCPVEQQHQNALAQLMMRQ
jgi:hypothetical protein